MTLLIALPTLAFAKTEKSISANDLAQSSVTVAVANWPDEKRGKSLSDSAVITFDADMEELINSGELTFNYEMAASCDECRTFKHSSTIVFKDAAGAEIEGTRWSVSDDSYSTYRQSKTAGKSGIVPKNTKTIEVTAACSTGTKTDLTLTANIVFTSTSNMDPTANGSNFTVTVKGDSFYATAEGDGSEAKQAQTYHFDYLKDESCYASDVDMFATIYLDGTAQALAAQSLLHYNASVTSSCGECRTMHNDITVRCFDASNKELLAGQWNVSEADYETKPQSKTYSSDTVFIPEGTAYLTLEASNEMTTTNSHLGLYGSLTVTCIKDMSYWDDNVSVDGTSPVPADFGLVNESDGKWLDFVDIFKGYSKRVKASDESTLSRSAIVNQNVLFNWAQFAYDVYKQNDAYWDHSGTGFDTAFGNNHYTDLVYQFTHQADGSTSEGAKDSNAWTSSSGVQQADSINDAVEAAMSDLAAQRKKMSSRAFGVSSTSDFMDDHDLQAALNSQHGSGFVDIAAQEGPVYYTFVNTTDQRGAEQYYYYNSFLMVFYDFEFVGVADETKFTVTPEQDAEPKPVISSTVLNDNAVKGSMTQSYAYSTSSTATNQITTSSTVNTSSTLGLGGSIGIKVGIPEVLSGDFSFNATGSWTNGEAFTFTDSKSVSDTVGETVSSGASVELPAYSTGIEMAEELSARILQEYDCPIAVQYKVIVANFNGKYYDDGAAISDHGYEDNTFAVAVGYNDVADDEAVGVSVSAQEALRNHFNTTGLNEAGLNSMAAPVSKIYGSDSGLKSGDDLLDYLKKTIPVTYEGAAYSDTVKNVTYSIEVYSSRPLAFTAITSVNSKFLRNENTLYLSEKTSYDLSNNVGVGGFLGVSDSQGNSVPYAGFSASEGIWAVYDKDGNAVPESVAKITQNAKSGHTSLELGDIDAETKLLVVYHINDGVYSYVNKANQMYGDNGYRKDSDLTVRASLNVVVQPLANEGSDEPAAEPSTSEGDSAAASEANATSIAFEDAAKRLNAAWGVYVATYGVVDPEDTITEAEVVNMIYATYCVAAGQLPQADPREDLEAFTLEAAAWAQAEGLTGEYMEGVSTYGEALGRVTEYLKSMAA